MEFLADEMKSYCYAIICERRRYVFMFPLVAEISDTAWSLN